MRSVAEVKPGRRDFREVAKANSLELRCNAQQYNSLYRCAVHMLALHIMTDHYEWSGTLAVGSASTAAAHSAELRSFRRGWMA